MLRLQGVIGELVKILPNVSSLNIKILLCLEVSHAT